MWGAIQNEWQQRDWLRVVAGTDAISAPAATLIGVNLALLRETQRLPFLYDFANTSCLASC